MLARGIQTLLPFLIEINQEHEIITKTSQSMSSGHGDDEREQIIDEGIERLRSVKVRVSEYGREMSSPCT